MYVNRMQDARISPVILRSTAARVSAAHALAARTPALPSSHTNCQAVAGFQKDPDLLRTKFLCSVHADHLSPACPILSGSSCVEIHRRLQAGKDYALTIPVKCDIIATLHVTVHVHGILKVTEQQERRVQFHDEKTGTVSERISQR